MVFPISARWREKLPENNKSVTLIFGTLEHVSKGQLLIAYSLKKTSWQTLGNLLATLTK